MPGSILTSEEREENEKREIEEVLDKQFALGSTVYTTIRTATRNKPYEIIECEVIESRYHKGLIPPLVSYTLIDLNTDRVVSNLGESIRSDQIFSSYEDAILAIINKIDNHIDEQEETKQYYLNMLKDHKAAEEIKEEDWIEEDLFQM